MLAAAQRLRRRGEFAATVRAGRRAAAGAVVVHLMTPAEAAAPGGARAGFVVPRNVGGAVVRNLVKRRLRHLMRDRLEALPAGTDVVVRALPGAGTRSYAQLAADLDGALAAARVRASRARGRRPAPTGGQGR